jgi:hypothetical protein
MDPTHLTLAAFQKHISQRYEQVDRARGWPKTFAYFLEEEFADVIAWLCTLANISDVNLSDAVVKKYLSDKPPEGHK